MLNQKTVDAEEERLRQLVSNLPDASRQQFYLTYKQQVKDPDTYAVLNWCFFAGMHHFYLRQWLRGVINLIVAIFGLGLLFTSLWLAGIVMLVVLAGVEFWALCHSQIIVQEYNNQLMQQIMHKRSSIVS